MKKNYSKHQKQVIGDYYKNLDTIMLQRLSELVSELFLADSRVKKDRLWQRAEKAMSNLNIPPRIKEHILNKRDLKILTKNLNDWLKM